ncbi:MAG: AAA family ATPase [Fibrobacter sp.]|nr:AAA family ATPase [Fibrobacter sp.]
MHKIVFKELTFRNFMSYGNNVNKFTFTDGLIWLHGDNGFGKSTIVEAMMFALFGVSYRGGNKADLRNSKNCIRDENWTDPIPDTEVNLVFDMVSQTETESYRVMRSLVGKKDTTKFVIEKLEGDQWVVQNKRAGYSQKDFEEGILQFNDVLFKNVIAMNTQETIPFIMMPAAKKRELLESIIAMSFDKWKKCNGKKSSEATMAFGIAESDIRQYGDEIANLNTIYQKMKDERATNVADMKDTVAKLRSDNDTLNEQMSELNKQKDALEAELTELRRQLDTEYSVTQEIQSLELLSDDIQHLDNLRAEEADYAKQYDENLATYNAMDPAGVKAAKDAAHQEYIDALHDNSHERNIASINAMITMLTDQCNQIIADGKRQIPGEPCPTCGKPRTEEEAEEAKIKLRAQLTEKKAELKGQQAKLDAEVAALEEYKSRVSALQDADNAAAERYDAVVSYNNTSVQPILRYKESISAKIKGVLNRMTQSGINDVAKAVEKLTELRAVKDGFVKIRADFDAKAPGMVDFMSKISTIIAKVDSNNQNIYRLEDDIRHAEENTDDSIAEMERRIQAAESNRRDAENRLHDASDTLAICKAITAICADTGLKQMLFSYFVPEFNKAVQKNLIQANLPFIITFDDSMNFTFTSIPGLASRYEMLSQGQKRKVGFAISMAFRDFVSLIGNFSVNFLSLDEVLDISTDDNAMREMLDLVKSMVADIGCAVVITHRGAAVADKFDYSLGVTYDGLYSRLEDLKEA